MPTLQEVADRLARYLTADERFMSHSLTLSDQELDNLCQGVASIMAGALPTQPAGQSLHYCDGNYLGISCEESPDHTLRLIITDPDANSEDDSSISIMTTYIVSYCPFCGWFYEG